MVSRLLHFTCASPAGVVTGNILVFFLLRSCNLAVGDVTLHLMRRRRLETSGVAHFQEARDKIVRS